MAATLLAGCDSSGSSSPESTSGDGSAPATPQGPPETLTFGVVGSADEVQHYRTMAETFAPPARKVAVKVEVWPSDAAMLDAFRHGRAVPDVFIANRRHLGYLTQHQLVQPVDGLLDDRGFDFGDEYPRSSLTAFGVDNRLECLPYGVQPEVIYYNKRLVDFTQIRNNPPTPGQGWSMEQFTTAARWAVRHHPGVAGIHLDPDLSGIAPFIYSGGGDLYDNASEPTSLALSGDANVQTLKQVVRALDQPGATLSDTQLARHTPLDWFVRGKLAFLEGSRRMVPDLRSVDGLHFDVMPMPSLGSSATVGSLTGMCLSSHAKDVATAADFLAYASSPGALALVAFGGYLQPANQTVALSDAFQQPGALPRHASVFTFSVKSMVYPPVLPQADELELRVDPLLDELLHSAPAEVPRVARDIDRTSYRILGPKLGPSPISPSPSG